MIGTLIHCTTCNAIINMTEADCSPHYTWNDGDITETAMDDSKAFLQNHKGHSTEQLTPLTPLISDKPYIEPLKTSYFEATNGTKRFLIKRWRDKIDEPFAYEIIEGRIALSNGALRVQTTAIKKQMHAEKGFLIPEEKVNYFIQSVRREVERLEPEALVASAEGATPLVSYYQLGSTCIDRILNRCRDTFTQGELNKLRDFINRYNEYDDVMTVVSKKEFAIQKKVQKEEQTESARSVQRLSISR